MTIDIPISMRSTFGILYKERPKPTPVIMGTALRLPIRCVSPMKLMAP